MKTNQFVIDNVSPVFQSKEDDGLLDESSKRFSGLNCRVTWKLILNSFPKLLGNESHITNIGNTNPVLVNAFNEYIEGFKAIDRLDKEGNPIVLRFIESEKLSKGSIFEFDYTIKIRNGDKHIVPIGKPRFIGFMNTKTAKRTDDKITALF